MQTRRALIAYVLLFVILIVVAFASRPGRDLLVYAYRGFQRRYTVEQRLLQFADVVASRLKPQFVAAGLDYPPAEVAFLVFKDERRLSIYGRLDHRDRWSLVTSYPILGLSGRSGPKLAEGDGQVPEGIYRAESLNPNSRFHLSIKLDYPNRFDQEMARRDGRTKLGGDIMIHGGQSSIGCVAVGDQVAEDLFVLAGLVSLDRVTVIVCPVDFRRKDRVACEDPPNWIEELYRNLKTELERFRTD